MKVVIHLIGKIHIVLFQTDFFFERLFCTRDFVLCDWCTRLSRRKHRRQFWQNGVNHNRISCSIGSHGFVAYIRMTIVTNKIARIYNNDNNNNETFYIAPISESPLALYNHIIRLKTYIYLTNGWQRSFFILY